MTKKERRKTLFFAIFFTLLTIVALCAGKGADSGSAILLFAVFAIIDWARLFYDYIRFHK